MSTRLMTICEANDCLALKREDARAIGGAVTRATNGDGVHAPSFLLLVGRKSPGSRSSSRRGFNVTPR
jgi:hypothetical protein